MLSDKLSPLITPLVFSSNYLVKHPILLDSFGLEIGVSKLFILSRRLNGMATRLGTN